MDLKAEDRKALASDLQEMLQEIKELIHSVSTFGEPTGPTTFPS